jgi:hypothetical protein
VLARLSGTSTAPTVTLTWTNNTIYASNVQVTQYIGPTPGTPILLANTATTYTDSTVVANTTYSYTVCAVNTLTPALPAACAAPVSIALLPPLPPTAVTASAARTNGQNDTLTANWANTPGNSQSGFTIRYSADSTFATGVTTATVAATASTFSATISGLRGTTLYVQVQATNVIGASAWAPANSAVRLP